MVPEKCNKKHSSGNSTVLVEMVLGMPAQAVQASHKNSALKKVSVKPDIRVDSASSSGLNDRVVEVGLTPQSFRQSSLKGNTANFGNG